ELLWHYGVGPKCEKHFILEKNGPTQIKMSSVIKDAVLYRLEARIIDKIHIHSLGYVNAYIDDHGISLPVHWARK
ncbi:hypothetical protein TNCV_4247931, partial [Trichonephila clavipes]